MPERSRLRRYLSPALIWTWGKLPSIGFFAG
jgi:hypothetical protein